MLGLGEWRGHLLNSEAIIMEVVGVSGSPHPFVFSVKQGVSSVESKEGKYVSGLRNEGIIVWESWRVDLPGKCDRMNRLHQ